MIIMSLIFAINWFSHSWYVTSLPPQLDDFSNVFYQQNFGQIGEVKVPLCMVDLAQTIEEWKDIQSLKVDDQVQSSLH